VDLKERFQHLLGVARRITDPEAAGFLLDGEKQVWIEPFMRGERTVTEAAEAQGLPVEKMYQHLQSLVRVGLVQDVGTRPNPRGGRAMRLYRAAADSFFVPVEVDLEVRAGRRNIERFAARIYEHYLAAVMEEYRPREAGFFVFPQFWTTRQDRLFLLQRLSDGTPLMPSSGPLQGTWQYGEVSLSVEEAREFREEMNAVLRRFMTPERSEGGQKYYYLVAFSPEMQHVIEGED
jgi:DNA-binding Lrp family transcriptional regulator